MAVMQLYHHGITCGVPGNNHGMAGKRGAVQGWTHSATKNNVRFLRSVTLPELTGVGVSFTLTLADCPPSAEVWHRARRAFIRRIERMGMTRLHWVTEWQRRGVPHLHGVAYFPEWFPAIESGIVDAWMALAEPYGAKRHCQHTTVIYDPLGWLKYLAKHAARGVSHYQRSFESIPPTWQKKTGRVWGHTGDWPTRQAIRIELDPEAFHRFRRIVKNWRIADARESGDARRMRSARRMLAAKDRVHSQLRGVSEWIDQETTLRVAEFLASQGYEVSC